MLAVGQGARGARPQQALGACGDSTQKTHLGSRCKCWGADPVFLLSVTHLWGSAVSCTRGVRSDDTYVHDRFVRVRWARFGLSAYHLV